MRTSPLHVIFYTACLIIHCCISVSQVSAETRVRELQSGWYPREPYQMEKGTGARTEITGLDIQISRELFEQSGHRVSFKHMSWAQNCEGLRDGTIDFLMGAYYDSSREAFAYYSRPYRTERNDIYYHTAIKVLHRVTSIQDVIDLLETEKLRLGVIPGHAYGAEAFKRLVNDPPHNLQLIPTRDYEESLRLTREGVVDLFVADPIIMDRLLAQQKRGDPVRKLGLPSREIPVHILFSKKSITKKELETYNAILERMQQQGHIRKLLRDFVLPAYLTITTNQPWFTLLNLLGIVAFCTSGVLLARKERYNLFGALVLATLPAIGGGVIRDLFLGVDRIFVLKTPVYFLTALCVVLTGFVIIKYLDFMHARSTGAGKKMPAFVGGRLSTVFDRLFRFFDAWAVASFTVVGVSEAISMRAEPLWLWGPAMAVLTSSGGVILRDIVRADFNIEMLKQDSYAEISIFGGLIYTCALVYSPYEMSLEYIFYLTMFTVFLLFGLRFYILWKGYLNPLQFGDMYTHPASRLQQFAAKEPELWKIISSYYTDDNRLMTTPVSKTRAENLHNEFLYLTGELKDSLDKVVAEPLNEQTIATYRQCSSRLEIAVSLENNLFGLLEQTAAPLLEHSADGSKLQQLMHESLRTMLDTAFLAIESGDQMDFSLLEGLTSKYRERFNDLRGSYAARKKTQENAHLWTVLHSTHKMERIIYLLGDYVRIRLNKKEFTTGSATTRKTQQSIVN